MIGASSLCSKPTNELPSNPPNRENIFLSAILPTLLNQGVILSCLPPVFQRTSRAWIAARELIDIRPAYRRDYPFHRGEDKCPSTTSVLQRRATCSFILTIPTSKSSPDATTKRRGHFFRFGRAATRILVVAVAIA